MKIAVVGGGIVGSCCAWRLADRGHRVTLFDSRPLGHEMGSSHGRSRIVRRTYDDAFYTAIMSEAYPMWREVEERAKEKLLNEVGLLMFGPEASKMLAEAETSMIEEAVLYKRITEIEHGPKLHTGERGLLIPEGGWVAADRAWSAIRAFSFYAGAIIDTAPIQDADDLKTFDQYILAPGPWIKYWVPDLDVKTTHQTFAYAHTAGPVGGPVWIHDNPALFYGFPSESGESSVKIGFHTSGKLLEDVEAHLEPDPAQLEAIRTEAARRFNLLDKELTGHRCIYTRTESEDFRIGHHGERGMFVSACSGHAFKMGPWLGKLMADLIEEEQRLDAWPRFRWPRV